MPSWTNLLAAYEQQPMTTDPFPTMRSNDRLAHEIQTTTTNRCTSQSID
jgi:hypothetical protein